MSKIRIIRTRTDYHNWNTEETAEVTPEEVINDIFKEYDNLGTLERLEKKVDFLSSLIASSFDLTIRQIVQIASYECRSSKYTIEEEANEPILDNK